MTANKSKLVGIVGPCGAGKTTITQALEELGYSTRHIAQEHSYVKDMWKRMTNPDILIYLHVSYKVAQSRRSLNWTNSDYEEQLRRLQHAREHADLVIDTDGLKVSELVKRTVEFLQKSFSRLPKT